MFKPQLKPKKRAFNDEEVSEPESQPEIIRELKNKSIIPETPSQTSGLLTIPLIKTNKYTLEEEAINALMNPDAEKPSVDDIAPILSRNKIPIKYGNEKDMFKYDVAVRPDTASLDAYEKVPVEEFGAAMLRGMGWKSGQGVGRNPKSALLKPVILTSRPYLLGLGAQQAPVYKKEQEFIKPGEKRIKTPAIKKTPERKPSALSTVDQSIRAGSRVKIVEGKYLGRSGVVIDIQHRDSGVVVKVKCSKYEDEILRVWREDVSLYL